MLPFTGDIAARFEARADSSVGGGRAQHPLDRQGSWGPAANCQPLAASLCRPWPRRAEGQAAAWQAADLYEDDRQADSPLASTRDGAEPPVQAPVPIDDQHSLARCDKPVPPRQP